MEGLTGAKGRKEDLGGSVSPGAAWGSTAGVGCWAMVVGEQGRVLARPHAMHVLVMVGGRVHSTLPMVLKGQVPFEAAL